MADKFTTIMKRDLAKGRKSMAYRFTVLENFTYTENDKVHSEYVKGLSYTVRDGNQKLHGLVQGWITDGKVTLATPSAEAEISGA